MPDIQIKCSFAKSSSERFKPNESSATYSKPAILTKLVEIPSVKLSLTDFIEPSC